VDQYGAQCHMTPDIQTRATAQFLKASFLVSFSTKPSLELH
jgi:hypothetical protein